MTHAHTTYASTVEHSYVYTMNKVKYVRSYDSKTSVKSIGLPKSMRVIKLQLS